MYFRGDQKKRLAVVNRQVNNILCSLHWDVVLALRLQGAPGTTCLDLKRFQTGGNSFPNADPGELQKTIL